MTPQTTPSLSITWQKPTFLLPLFCLCPLLGASNSLAMALALSSLMTIITTSMMVLVFLSRQFVPQSLHTMVGLIISSTVIAIMEMMLHAWNYELYRALGLFMPLMVLACLLVCRPDMNITASFTQLLRNIITMNAGFAFAALVLGAGREVIGHGSLFHDVASIFGPSWNAASVTFFPSDMGFMLGVLAPGAFIGFGIGVALYNWVWLHLPHKNTSVDAQANAQR